MRCLAPPRFLLQPRSMVASLAPSSLAPSSHCITMAADLFPCVQNPPFKHSTLDVPSRTSLLSPQRLFSSKFSSSSSSAVSAACSKLSKCQAVARSSIAFPETQDRSSKLKRSSSSSSVAICPGCGIPLQSDNPGAPGFFTRPIRLVEQEQQKREEVEVDKNKGGEPVLALDKLNEDATDADGGEELVGALGDQYDFSEEEDVSDLEDGSAVDGEGGEDFDEEDTEQESSSKRSSTANWTFVQLAPSEAGELEVAEEKPFDEKEWRKGLDGFGPAGPEYGRGSDGGWNQVGGNSLRFGKKKKDSNSKDNEQEKLVVCARCHQLRNYGKVQDENKENLLPDFDFEDTVGRRLVRTHAARTVVVIVVDSADFDGSFPRRAVALLSDVLDREGSSWKENRSGNLPRLVLVANKIDLLPKQISPIRLDHWIRRRAKEGGAPHLSALFLVSCVKNWGIKAVLQGVKDLAGPRGEVWVIGAQNAGKSSLINALSKVEAGAKLTQLTEAAVPGTTLGILRLNGILPAKAKLFDTPGLLHPHQLTVRLSREEQKLVQVRKELKPRTYRIGVGNTLHVGGLVRLDVTEISASTMYITVWGSATLTCHLGKTKKAMDTYEKYVGVKLQPPSSKERLQNLGPWVQTPVTITGDSWDRSSCDIAIAGFGWFGLGLKGTATLDVWTYEGVTITTRNALVPDMARIFESTGFTS